MEALEPALLSDAPGILNPSAPLDHVWLVMPADRVVAVMTAAREQAAKDTEEPEHGRLVAPASPAFRLHR